jgi:hypothetical protein
MGTESSSKKIIEKKEHTLVEFFFSISHDVDAIVSGIKLHATIRLGFRFRRDERIGVRHDDSDGVERDSMRRNQNSSMNQKKKGTQRFLCEVA